MGITLGIVGYGEVGGIFGRGLLRQSGIDAVWVWDLKFSDTAGGAAARAAAEADGMRVAPGMQALCAAADLAISAVTASNTFAVAGEAARHARAGTRFLDLNSASPGTKQQAGAALEAAGVAYIEAGVMTARRLPCCTTRLKKYAPCRSQEMREAAHTVRETGFEPFMAAAIANKLGRAAGAWRHLRRAGWKKPLAGIRRSPDWPGTRVRAARP